MRKSILRVSAAALCVMAVLSGCSGKSAVNASPPSQSGPTSAGTPAGSATTSKGSASAGPVVLRHRVGYRLVSTDGYTASVTLAQGELMRAAPGAVSNGTELGSRCTQVNAATDAVVPFHITLTSAPKSLSYRPTAVLVGYWPGAKDLSGNPAARLFIEYSIVQGGGCMPVYPLGTDNTSGAPSLTSKDTLAPDGDSVGMSGWLIVTHYYSSKQPKGNSLTVRDATLSIQSGDYNTTSVGGTGTKRMVGRPDISLVPWNPANRDGGCLVTGEANCR